MNLVSVLNLCVRERVMEPLSINEIIYKYITLRTRLSTNITILNKVIIVDHEYSFIGLAGKIWVNLCVVYFHFGSRCLFKFNEGMLDIIRNYGIHVKFTTVQQLNVKRLEDISRCYETDEDKTYMLLEKEAQRLMMHDMKQDENEIFQTIKDVGACWVGKIQRCLQEIIHLTVEINKRVGVCIKSIVGEGDNGLMSLGNILEKLDLVKDRLLTMDLCDYIDFIDDHPKFVPQCVSKEDFIETLNNIVSDASKKKKKKTKKPKKKKKNQQQNKVVETKVEMEIETKYCTNIHELD